MTQHSFIVQEHFEALFPPEWWAILERELPGVWPAPVVVQSVTASIFHTFGNRAVVIDGTIHLTERWHELDMRTRFGVVGHELKHVEDQREIPFGLYVVRYAWHDVRRRLRRRPPREHPMEVDAYAFQARLVPMLPEIEWAPNL